MLLASPARAVGLTGTTGKECVVRYHWTEKDAEPGTMIRSTRTNATNAIAIIGYTVLDKTFTVVSLADGQQVVEKSSLEEIAEWLNEAGYRPCRIVFTEQVHDRFAGIK